MLKKLVLNFFDKEKYVLHNGNLQLYLRLIVLEFNKSQWFDTQNRKRWKKDKDGNAL